MSVTAKFWNPPPPPDERGLRPELPVPPFVMIGDVECLLERIPVEALPGWREKHNLERIGAVFMGRLGWVNVSWPEPREEDSGR